MFKQAYLIMAHRYDETFRTLIKMLDCSENDIFVHMDKKNEQFEETECSKLVERSRIFFTERTNVSWGGYSGIRAEIILIKTATSHGKYHYYHLLSGQDLPIQSNDYIKNFFINHNGYEFVAFDKEKFDYQERVEYFYPLQEIVGRNRKSVLGKVQSLVVFIQKSLHIKRNSKIHFQKGANWFSITDDLARYVVERENWIKETFCNTLCGDEVFLQTIVLNSPFMNRVYQYIENPKVEEAAMRLIDWERGGPYVFRSADFQELMGSKMLFARKFDCEKDADVIRKVYNKIKEER